MESPTSLANHFLIAIPSMLDPNFSRGVTLLCQHGEDGAMGILVNRLSEYTIGEVLSQMGVNTADDALAASPVLLGGPVQPDRGFVLHDGDDHWESSLRISERLCVTTSRDILVAMAEGSGPGRSLLALGYAGWTAGQLESELQEDAWLTVPVSEGILFETPIEQRWQTAARLMGVDMDRLAGYSGRA
jgi:putative transcriptional regulator